MLSSALRRVLQKLFSCTTAPLGYLYSVQDAGAKKKKRKKKRPALRGDVCTQAAKSSKLTVVSVILNITTSGLNLLETEDLILCIHSTTSQTKAAGDAVNLGI